MNSQDHQEPGAVFRQLLIMWGAMVTGLVLFLVVVLVTIRGQPANPNPVFSMIVPLFAAAQLVAAMVLSKVLRSRADAVPPAETTNRRAAVVALHLVKWAMIEGPALFALVVLMITRTPWPGLVIGGGCMAAMAWAIPRRDDVAAMLR